MKIKRLLALLEGLYNADPKAGVFFVVSNPDAHAKAQLVCEEVPFTLGIRDINLQLDPPYAEEQEGDNFMSVVIDLECDDVSIDIMGESDKFDTMYKKVTE